LAAFFPLALVAFFALGLEALAAFFFFLGISCLSSGGNCCAIRQHAQPDTEYTHTGPECRNQNVLVHRLGLAWHP
jgi:hypothetical protein